MKSIWQFLSPVLLALFALTPGVCPAGESPSPWGICCHPHAPEEWKNIDRQLGMMRDAGMTSLRTDLKFSRVARKKGEYDFRIYDELLTKLDEYGIEFLPILEGYDWEIEKTRPDVRPLYRHPEEWRAYVRAAAAHYRGKIRHWEIWNEQDGGFWKPHPDASQYVLLLKIAYEELKAADPENVVVVGGLCGWMADYMKEMYAAGAKGFFDVVAVHPYGWGPDRSGFQRNRMLEFKQVMAAHGDAELPVWITEFGGATHSSTLIDDRPDVIWQAIRHAATRIGRELPEAVSVAAPVSLEHADREFQETRRWLPGISLIPVTPERLAALDPAEVPVMIGGEHVTVEEEYVIPMLEYVKKGGILLAFGDVPFYNVRFRNERGNWSTRGAASELHPMFRIGYEAWWTRKELPQHTSKVRTTQRGREAGIAELSGAYATRYLSGKNGRDNDQYIPLVEALDGKGEPVGDVLTLHIFADYRGAVLACTMQLEAGFTEEEQARLLETAYLSYLAEGVSRLYFYDFHNDGMTASEKENNFGLVRWNYQPKPAYHRYAGMTQALGPRPRFLRKLTETPPEVTALLFPRADGGEVLAYWSTGEAAGFEWSGRYLEAGADVSYLSLHP